MSEGDLADVVMLRHAVVTVGDFLTLCYGARVRVQNEEDGQ